jgi:hypothetical protein
VYSSGDEALEKVHIGCSHVRRDDATSSMVYVTMAWSKDHGIACEAMRTRGKTSWRIPTWLRGSVDVYGSCERYSPPRSPFL